MDFDTVLLLKLFFCFVSACVVAAVLCLGLCHLIDICEEYGKLGELRQQNERLRTENYLLVLQCSKLKEEIILCTKELGHENSSDSHGETKEATRDL